MITLTGYELIQEAWVDWQEFADDYVTFDKYFPEMKNIRKDKSYTCTDQLSDIEEVKE
ncbi:hypothetical protein FC70_GL001766 [Paucilactobacillus oligofermentans DSM 15707 = LMG 22743]|uniref:Uncharacterized protein n=1 Tax=Paucilactobacillus oligofermentans DSM 15707 = LMG 22743 TaxID=1423778 RepID=A0A0R1RN62_9LACO|nr:hypothetical protein [Paucilactobacillus oligofermentans]KRL54963.1 hypothetical protein FC70_GL001766 [Paucilactobacillus oligofermentans DSM 15707 = LMG 22743]CUS26120.1 Uncharacterized protein LACOL_0812 [Paucilactobacillus oligofermentans DSM 15707 = LMG 22743]